MHSSQVQSHRQPSKVDLLIDNPVKIKDETGQFPLSLPDGHIIDTKGWNDWE